MSIQISKGEDVFKYELSKHHIKAIKLFGLGSISKTIISTYLSYMINQGKIDINQKIDYYLSLNEHIKYPTVLELATHTSGYHAFIPILQSIKVLLFNGFNKKNIYAHLNQKWSVNDLHHRKPFRNKKYRYSDYNYAVLALLIEHIEKRPYQEVIESYLKKEIDMKDTHYGTFELTKHSKYSWVWEDDNPFLASGGLFSTCEDMTKFLKYQISHANELIDAHKKYIKINQKNIYSGFSWNAFYSGSFYWHIGGQGYFRSYALFDIKRDITISLLATVDINLLHVGRIGSSLYRNIKRNHSGLVEFLDEMIDQII